MPKKTTDPALINALLDDAVLARLATADPRSLQPHVVPVWFLWDGTSIWISAFESTRKLKELLRNPRCAVLIEAKEPGKEPGKLEAVLMEGTAEVIEMPRELVREKSIEIYTRYMGPQGVLGEEPQSWSRDPENRLVKLTPEMTRAW